jgi:hypothetical protein
VVMLVCYMIDLPLLISIPASLGAMVFFAFKGDSHSKRKQDQRLLLPSDEPPVAP